MTNACLDDYDVEEVLAKVHSDVTHLKYECRKEKPEWSDVAKAFPSLSSIELNCYSYRADQSRLIDAVFFAHFPALKQLLARGCLVQLEGVDPANLSQLETVTISSVLDAEYLSVFGNLPKLSHLEVSVQGTSLVFDATSASALEFVSLVLPSVELLDIDLRAVRSLRQLDLNDESYHYDKDTQLTVKRLSLPDSLDELRLSLPCVDGLPENVLGDTPHMSKLEMNITTAALPEKMFGNLLSADELTIMLKKPTASLPDGLFSQLKRVDRLSLRMNNSPCNIGCLLHDELTVKELALSNAKGVMSGFAQVKQPALEQIDLFGASIDDLGFLNLCSDLQHLSLGSIQGLMDTAVFPQLPNLKALALYHCDGTELHPAIRTLAQIEQLTIQTCRLQALGDLSAMSSLEKVVIDDVSMNLNPANSPELSGLLTLPAFKSLELAINPDEEEGYNLEALAALPPGSSVEISLYDNGRRSEMLQKQLAVLINAELTVDQKRNYWQQLLPLKFPRELPIMDGRFYLTFMEARYTPYKKQALAWLRQVAESTVAKRPLDRNSCIFICGRSGFKSAEIKAKSAELGFSISKKLDDKVTHILVGNNPKGTAAIDPEQHLLVDDTALQQFFQQEAPQFLQQESAVDSGMIDSVLEMLNSPDEASHRVAIEMLAQGGVTSAMLMPLFLILKMTSDNGLRAQIKALLAGHGSELFQLAVNDRILFNAVRGDNGEGWDMGEGPMFKKLKGQLKKWGPELCFDFAKHYFDRYGEGLLLVLTQKEDSPQRLAIISELIEGECLNWNKGCGFNGQLEGASEKRMTDSHRYPDIYMQHQNMLGEPKTRLPKTLPASSKITELNLSNCYLGALPFGFELYTDVTKLSLRFNHLEGLPAKLAKLTELEELDLSYNHFDEFPKVLFKLKKLKLLDFRRPSQPDYRTGYGSGYESVAVPQVFRDAFPDCEILED
ncbi:BRCT domain-containing protein [Photobacterium kasasachensis]|uniref:BRCT domain-containing protein n=1 Tax=Photobacterium kasasachensis TaxID=2910240 RepID=UPI003D0B5396